MIIQINNKDIEVDNLVGDKLLIDFLREDLNLTGTKNGCGIGVCGACTVLVNNNPVRACRKKIKDIDDNEVTKKFSVNGWIDENILISLLNDISVKVNGKECALMLDRYSVHKNPKIKETAYLLKIKLI